MVKGEPTAFYMKTFFFYLGMKRKTTLIRDEN